jgi:ethanolamine utilization protein EutN
MRICRVIGSVVAAAHHPAYDARTVLLVRPETASGATAAAPFVAVDTVQAGPGDRVLVLSEGNAVRQILGAAVGPIRSLIVGIVDHVDTPCSP